MNCHKSISKVRNMAPKIEDIILFVFLVFFGNSVLCNPKKYEPENDSFEPSHRYYESDIDEYRAHAQNRSKVPERKHDANAKESRFGIIPISTYDAGVGSQYGGGGGTMAYGMSPLKLDLGGVALGALIGLGAVLILPKIAHIFSGGMGGYRGLETELSPITDILARIDNSLEQNDIDSNSCMQRVICSYVSDAQKNINNGESSGLNDFVYSLTNNTLFSYALDGSAVKQAADIGKSGDSEKCSSLFSKCPVTKETVLKIIANLLPA